MTSYSNFTISPFSLQAGACVFSFSSDDIKGSEKPLSDTIGSLGTIGSFTLSSLGDTFGPLSDTLESALSFLFPDRFVTDLTDETTALEGDIQVLADKVDKIAESKIGLGRETSFAQVRDFCRRHEGLRGELQQQSAEVTRILDSIENEKRTRTFFQSNLVKLNNQEKTLRKLDKFLGRIEKKTETMQDSNHSVFTEDLVRRTFVFQRRISDLDAIIDALDVAIDTAVSGKIDGQAISEASYRQVQKHHQTCADLREKIVEIESQFVRIDREVTPVIDSVMKENTDEFSSVNLDRFEFQKRTLRNLDGNLDKIDQKINKLREDDKHILSKHVRYLEELSSRLAARSVIAKAETALDRYIAEINPNSTLEELIRLKDRCSARLTQLSALKVSERSQISDKQEIIRSLNALNEDLEDTIQSKAEEELDQFVTDLRSLQQATKMNQQFAELFFSSEARLNSLKQIFGETHLSALSEKLNQVRLGFERCSQTFLNEAEEVLTSAATMSWQGAQQAARELLATLKKTPVAKSLAEKRKRMIRLLKNPQIRRFLLKT